MPNEISLIGIDGGASKINAHIIEISDDGKSFTLGKDYSVKEYRNYPDFQLEFKPVSLPIQLEQIQTNNIVLTPAEIKQSKAYYSAFIEAISDLVELTKAEYVLIGIGMPGVKTTDKRGIAAMANGPRLPNFTTEIEKRLTAAGITLLESISKLGSDADYCGIGEEYSKNGAFCNIKNAYYLGGGTGAADALKLHGKLISFDESKDWIAKTWEMSDANGKSMEIYCSANGIQSVYSSISEIPQSEIINNIYLDQILCNANDGEKEALQTWEIVIENLSLLISERITTIYCGWQNNFSFINPNKPPLDPNHIYENTVLDRIVIGQRLGILFQNPIAPEYLIEPLLNNLAELISTSKFLDERAKSHYLKEGKFNNDIIVTSQLREAPALGAGIDAYKNMKSKIQISDIRVIRG